MNEKGLLRIAHVGMYDRNIGDSIALLGARDLLKECTPRPIKFTKIDMYPMCFGRREVVEKELRRIEQDHDLIVFGGGGLIEGMMYKKSPMRWKMPIDAGVMSWLCIPIICLGLGVNTWRPFEEFSAEARRGIESLLARSRLVSLRDDGSRDKLRDILGADPPQCIESASMAYVALRGIPPAASSNDVLFQPSMNKNYCLMRGRFPQGEQQMIAHVPRGSRLLPHTPKDYHYGGQFAPLMPLDALSKGLALHRVRQWIERWYSGRLAIALRGHGVLLSLMRGIPGVYVATMDKVSDFCRTNGLDAWCLDTRDQDFEARFQSLVDAMLDRGSSAYAQWHVQRETFLAQQAVKLGALKEAVRDAMRDL